MNLLCNSKVAKRCLLVMLFPLFTLGQTNVDCRGLGDGNNRYDKDDTIEYNAPIEDFVIDFIDENNRIVSINDQKCRYGRDTAYGTDSFVFASSSASTTVSYDYDGLYSYMVDRLTLYVSLLQAQIELIVAMQVSSDLANSEYSVVTVDTTTAESLGITNAATNSQSSSRFDPSLFIDESAVSVTQTPLQNSSIAGIDQAPTIVDVPEEDKGSNSTDSSNVTSDQYTVVNEQNEPSTNATSSQYVDYQTSIFIPFGIIPAGEVAQVQLTNGTQVVDAGFITSNLNRYTITVPAYMQSQGTLTVRLRNTETGGIYYQVSI